MTHSWWLLVENYFVAAVDVDVVADVVVVSIIFVSLHWPNLVPIHCLA